MNCCRPPGCEDVFTQAQAERDLRRYRRRGLPGTAAWLRNVLVRGGVDGETVLEIGGGIGSLQVELLEAGASRAINLELVESYEPAARSLAQERAVDGRVERRLGDLVVEHDIVPRSSIVVMHRVVCCYPDWEGLLAAAASRAEHRLALTFPTPRWWVRLGFTTMNCWLRLRRSAFRAYVHPPGQMLAFARRAGFEVDQEQNRALWSSVVLERATA
jgi:hypothetical protein